MSRTGTVLARLAFYGGLAAALTLLAGPLAWRTGLLGIGGAVIVAPGIALLLAAIALLLGLVAFALSLRPGDPARARAAVLVGLLLSAAVLINVATQFSRARALPSIHDITTAPEDPPAFQAIVPLRADAPNGLDYDADALAAPTREAYPFVRPIRTALDPAAAYARALEVAAALGWRIVAADPAAGRIEATDRTLFYGFEDDVVIRIRPAQDGAGARLDLRSVSRVGQSDLGANAERIRAFTARFEGG